MKTWGQRGQAIVEAALILPVALFAALGFSEGGVLLWTQQVQQADTSVLATWAASHPGEDWAPTATFIGLGAPCAVTVTDDGSLVEVGATCPYTPRITSNLWSGLPISTEAEASLAGAGGTSGTCTLGLGKTTAGRTLSNVHASPWPDCALPMGVFLVNWGDGTPVVMKPTAAFGGHTYVAAGTYVLAITVIDALGIVGTVRQTLTFT